LKLSKFSRKPSQNGVTNGHNAELEYALFYFFVFLLLTGFSDFTRTKNQEKYEKYYVVNASVIQIKAIRYKTAILF
jgi:hypothetical protein